MSLVDADGLRLSTQSHAARDDYLTAIERLLCAQPGIEDALTRALQADPGFALAHAALARSHQVHGRGAEARAAMTQAVLLAQGLGDRERSHVLALDLVVQGDGPGALKAIREHLQHWPRDRLVMQPSTGVFGLFGFSGLSGREQAQDDFLDQYQSACGDDWWFQASRAFSQCEIGHLEAAQANIERSLERQPRNANGAHIRTHIAYEHDDGEPARTWLSRWMEDYPAAGFMHCHLSWHLALAALDAGDLESAWKTFETAVKPGAAWGPPLNVMTDGVSFVLRAELAGAPRSLPRWQQLADYAAHTFPKNGAAFADVHAALAFAMAGRTADWQRVRANASGPAAELVAGLADAFTAHAQDDPVAVQRALLPWLTSHERIGGSRAQRDLIEYLMLVAQRRTGTTDAWLRHRPRRLPAGIAEQ